MEAKEAKEAVSPTRRSHTHALDHETMPCAVPLSFLEVPGGAIALHCTDPRVGHLLEG